MIAETCVGNLSFDACHITPVDGVLTLHGHTFRVEVCVRGEVSSEGWVIDFIRLKELINEVLRPFKYSVIIPSNMKGSVIIEGRFSVKYLFVKGPEATAEVIASRICEGVRDGVRALGVKALMVEVRLWEGSENFVRVSCK